MKYLIGWTFALFAVCLPISGIASPLSECNDLVSTLNEQVPMRIDKVTTWKTTVCLPTSNGIKLSYVYVVDVAKGQISQANLNTLRPSQLHTWCTDPAQQELFQMFDIEYRYFDKENNYIGVLNYRRSMC